MPIVGQSVVRKFFPNCISVIYKNDIVLLVSNYVENPLDIESNEDFLDLLKTNQMTASISEVFYDPIKTRKHYQQSIKALELGIQMQPEKHVFFYYELSIFHAFEICAKTINLRDLCHPLVIYLNNSESESDKDLLKTLYFWLLYERDTLKILNELHIHRSTLFYRINKIKEMIGSDLNDGNLIFQLILSFKIIQYFSGFVSKSDPYWLKHTPQL